MKKSMNVLLSTLLLVCFSSEVIAAPTGNKSNTVLSKVTALNSDSGITKAVKPEPGVKNGKFVGNSYWATVSDDKVGGKKVIQSIIEISSNDHGIVTGKILVPFTRIDDEKAMVPSLICTECNGSLKDKPIIGLQIMNAKATDGSTYKGNIIDPTTGKDYTLKMWLSDGGNVLSVRGYIMFFYRTQNWYHVDSAVAESCSAWFTGQTYAKNSSQGKDGQQLSADKYAFYNGAPAMTSKDLVSLCK